jgi:hypothetical protein
MTKLIKPSYFRQLPVREYHKIPLSVMWLESIIGFMDGFKRRFNGFNTTIGDVFYILISPILFLILLLFGYFIAKAERRYEKKVEKQPIYDSRVVNKDGEKIPLKSETTLTVQLYTVDWKRCFSKEYTPDRYEDY